MLCKLFLQYFKNAASQAKNIFKTVDYLSVHKQTEKHHYHHTSKTKFTV